MTEDEKREKLFKELIVRKAGCIEMAFNGFILMKEKGEPPCECVDCKKDKEINV